VKINDALTLDFLVDSGATTVSMPVDVVSALVRLGTLAPGDFLGSKEYQMADGSILPSQTFQIRSLCVGDTVLQGVTGSTAPVHGGLLLGQSFLSRFRSWSIDNGRQVLVLNKW
jgi:predicted aspartyl protease